MAIQTFAGATVAISTVPFVGTIDSTGFGAATYTTIAEVTAVPAFGKVYKLVTHNPIGTRYTKKLKGSYDNGKLDLKYALDTSDAGQTLLQTASDSDSSYAYKLTMQNGTLYYFTAKAMSYQVEGGSVNSIVGGMTSLEIDSDIVKV